MPEIPDDDRKFSMFSWQGRSPLGHDYKLHGPDGFDWGQRYQAFLTELRLSGRMVRVICYSPTCPEYLYLNPAAREGYEAERCGICGHTTMKYIFQET